MWLLLLLIRSLMLFSFISISSCALSANKETTLSNNGKLSPEGSGSIPANEVFSDDEDFTPNLMKPSHSSMLDFSGDGSLDHYTDQEQGPGLITHGHGHPKPTDTFSHSDDEDEGTNDDDDDEDDDEGSGDSDEAKSTDSFSTKETIIDDDHPKITDTIHPKPDISIIHPDESEDRATITGDDDDDKSSDNSFPNVIETSTKQYKPNHDPDHEDHDQDENTSRNDISILGHKQDTRPVSFFAQPSMLAAVIGGTVVSLLCAILLAMFIIYRTRRKDEASYICEPNLTSPVISHYGKGSSNKFFDP